MLPSFPPRSALFAVTLSLFSGSSFAQDGEAKPADDTAAPKAMTEKKHAHTNRLANEKSPYLLQHAHNPVDWYPWGEEAFRKAKEEDKPILLSIGYSTCHWCHVMERESFENEEIAALMNKNFICIKLDREERPDVDKIYMTFVQAVSGGGGWPLNVILTPERKPFFGGTYFPPVSKGGQPSWPQVLEHITKLWGEKRKEINESADDTARKLAEMVNQVPEGPPAEFNADTIKNALTVFKAEFDPKDGGWGAAPKFPRPSQPLFMLRAAKRFDDKEAIDQVLHTCDMMAAGGMHDQIGGGFARYSVDAQWLVPHFEKMLYDNAQMLQLYLEAYEVSGEEERYATVARDIITYVLRDMTHPKGGFYSAEDADSEGKEGKFYCWTKKELQALLTKEEFEAVVEYFGVTEEGNFLDHSDPDALPGQNVLHIASPSATPTAETKTLVESARSKLFAVREKRVRPGLDDKILTSWNGLMLGSLARAYAALGDPSYLEAAEKNVAFIKSAMWDAEAGKLFHRWRDGERDTAQLLDTHAYLLDGLIELYEATLDSGHLEFALAVAKRMVDGFYDKEHGGFYQSADGSEDLLMRVKEDYDGAEPSGNSVACLALLKLAAITDNAEYRGMVEKTFHLFAERLTELPQAAPYLLEALDFSLQEPARVVLAGDPASETGKKLLAAAHSVYQPNKVILGTVGPVEEFAKTLKPKDADASVYLCKGTHCELPTSDPKKVAEMLK
jgi:uncharacterized protein YyaL (SSP411 family)